MVPKNMTHLLQPPDVTTNGTIKKSEKKKAFSNYITSIITSKMLIDSSRDVTTIKIDLNLSTHTDSDIQLFQNKRQRVNYQIGFSSNWNYQCYRKRKTREYTFTGFIYIDS